MSMYKVTISCVDGLDMAAQMNAAMSMQRLLKTLQEEYTLNIQSSETTGCRFSVQVAGDEISQDGLKEKIEEFLGTEQYRIQIAAAEEAEVNSEAVSGEAEVSDEGKAEPSMEAASQENTAADRVDSVMQKIRRLIGAEEFKAMADELCRLGKTMSDMGDFFCNNTYMFSIDDGCGLSTALEYFAELSRALSLVSSGKAEEFQLLKDSDSPAEISAMKDALASFLARSGGDGVICIDLSQCCDSLARAEYREMLKLCSDKRRNILVFRMPFVEPHAQNTVVEVLNDLFYVHSVTFDPFTMEDLFTAAEEKAKQFGFEIDGDMMPVITDMVAHEKSDGRFYGIRTMEKIVTQLIYEKLQGDVGGGTVMHASDFGKRDNIVQDEQCGEDKLRTLIGMENVAAQIDEIVSLVEYA
ncbi:MAG: hypothetical protein LUC83_07810, partial [Clostridiales bacterium]|nr:hypothetical protein [Clostridiales bacterium]